MRAQVDFLLSFSLVVLGAAFISAIALGAYASAKDRGLAWILAPIAPLYLSLLLEFLRSPAAANPATGLSPFALAAISNGARLLSGYAWALFCHRHYRLYGVGRRLAPIEIGLGALTAANVVYFVLSEGFGLLPSAERAQNAVMALTALYAGVMAIFLLVKRNSLRPSSWAGIAVAILCLATYPMVLAADLFGLPFPLLDPGRPAWSQAQPFLLLTIMAAFLPALAKELRFLRDRRPDPGDAAEPPSPDTELTARERQARDLLMAGKSYKQVAEGLGVSLSTAKTHIMKLYAKLGVNGRRGL